MPTRRLSRGFALARNGNSTSIIYMGGLVPNDVALFAVVTVGDGRLIPSIAQYGALSSLTRPPSPRSASSSYCSRSR